MAGNRSNECLSVRFCVFLRCFWVFLSDFDIEIDEKWMEMAIFWPKSVKNG
jgi:hypothetical protein